MFERHVLDNDVRVITAQQDVQSATALVMFGAGSRNEERHQSGIAHFAEHMFFKGTERRPHARDISVEIDGIGGEFNAFTGKEYTGYYVKCAAEHLSLAVDVLSDMLLHSRFDAEEIEREKGVILEEMNMYHDMPVSYIQNVYDQLFWGDHPLGWDIIGHEDVIRGADRDLFMGFLDRWYTGNRTVVGLAGKVDPAVIEQVDEQFQAIPASTPGSALRADRSQSGPQVRVHRKGSDQAHLSLGVPALSSLDDDRYALNVLNAILGGGMSSRLFVEVRERLGLCYYVRSSPHAYTDAGTLVVQAGVDIDRIELAIEVIQRELFRVLEEAPPQEEVDKARNYLKGHLVLRVEDPRGLAMFGVTEEAVRNRLLEPEESLARLDAVTRDDVVRVAREVLRTDLLNLAVIGPFEDDARFADLVGAGAASVSR